jgi:hypothetical protein
MKILSYLDNLRYELIKRYIFVRYSLVCLSR